MPTKEKSTTTDPSAGLAGLVQPSDLATIQSLMFNPMTRVATNWVEAVSDMGSEVVSFVANRIKEDVKTQHEILHCGNLAQLHEIQTRFLQKAIDQYTAETGKLVEMSHHLFPTGGDDADKPST